MNARIFLFAVALLAGSSAFAQNFSGTLLGANEVPPADPDGSGTAAISIAGTTVTYSIIVNGIAAPTMQHIHSGAAGVNGPVVINLPGPFVGNTLSGTTTTTLAQATAIINNPGGFYFNVHNAEFPGGAIRGQLVAVSGQVATVSTTSTLGLIALASVLLLAGVVAVRRR